MIQRSETKYFYIYKAFIQYPIAQTLINIEHIYLGDVERESFCRKKVLYYMNLNSWRPKTNYSSLLKYPKMMATGFLANQTQNLKYRYAKYYIGKNIL